MKSYLIILILLISVFISALPEPPVRLCAEWEPALGTLIRWPLGIPYELVYNLAADDSLYVLVENEAQEYSALSSFTYHGINTQNCRFIYAVTNSHWTRDWGPQSIFYGQGEWGILDPQFDGYPWVPGGRDYDDDDVVNQVIAEEFDCDVFSMPAYLTGGNIMTDGMNTAFSTQQMLEENYDLGYNSSEFFSLVYEYGGIETYNILPNIENYGIQHIDCGAKLLNEETVLIKRLPEWHPEFQRLEDLTEQFASLTNCYGREFEIFRIDCPSYSGNDCAAYTNSLILNHKVLVPMFGIPADTQALITYQEAMPGYQVIGIYYDNWYYYDALHCRTREIIDRHMLYMQHRPLDSVQPANQQIEVSCRIKPCSGEDLVLNHLYLFWRESGSSQFDYQNLTASAMTDTFLAVFPLLEQETQYEYYLMAEDYSGRIETLPRTAPDDLFTFTTDNSTANSPNELAIVQNLSIHPNPFNPATTINFYLLQEAELKIAIYNIKGKLIRLLANQTKPAGLQSFTWNGTNIQNLTCPSGIYFCQIAADSQIINQKILLLK